MNEFPPVNDFANLISATLLRLRMRSPFFGMLAMFARFVPSQTISTAATDGREIFLNPEFLRSLPSPQQDGVILHEILHAALLHPLRLKEREPELWNIAADIVVNGLIMQQRGVELPPDGLRDENLERLSVEEVYELLRQPPTNANRFQLADLDLLAPSQVQVNMSNTANSGDLLNLDREATVTAYWRNALQQATIIARSTGSGKLPGGIDRELETIVNPQLDWRAYLWRYLVQTPTDFQGFDRRLIGRGLYLEALQGESVQVYVAVDTSGSVGDRYLQLFIEEIRGILAAYPHLECTLYYADRELYGPYLLTPTSTIPTPQGGGGTSFVPFFDRVADIWDGHTRAVCIYLTDGYGEFPAVIPILPTLWVVTPGGLDLTRFPFGEAVRSS
jgi:predicted metal-dependent peptidase